MKAKELRGRPGEELLAVVQEKRSRLRSSRFELAYGRTKNVAALKALRKDIARALTLLKEKTLS